MMDGRASHEWDYLTGRCKQCGITVSLLDAHFSAPQYTYCTRPIESAVYQINDWLGMKGSAEVRR